MRPSESISVAFLVCLGVFCLSALALSAPATADEHRTGPNVTQTIEITVDEDGDARIRVITTLEAKSDEQQSAFQDVATEFRRGQFEERSLWVVARSVVDELNEETEREMQLEGPNRESELNESGGVGRLVLSFEWQSFARATEDKLVVRDVWAYDDQVWIRSLDERQRLELRVPPNYDVEDAQPDSFRDRALVWEGPRTFGPDDLSATYTRSDESGLPVVVGLAVGALALALVVGGGVLYRRRSETGRSVGDDVTDEPTTDDSPTGVEPTSGDGGTTIDAESSDESDSTEEPAANSDSNSEPSVDPELLSDEERVERLLRQNGGRMKQANIVKETGWSNAKVSQLLSEMDENDRIDKLRLGRENLIALPDEDLTELE